MATSTERWADRSLTKADSQWQAQRTFDVVSAATQSDACDAIAIALGDAHPESPALVAKSINARANGQNAFVVTVSYGALDNSFGGGATGNPLNAKPKIRWGKITSTENFDRDINGRPLVNSVGDPNPSGFPRLIFSRSLTITRNEPFYDTVKADTYQGAVSSDEFTFLGFTYPAGCVQCLGVIPASEYDQDSTYVPVQYEFEIRLPIGNLTALQRRHPFQLRFLDQGERGVASTGLGVFYNNAAVPEKCSAPVRLNGRAVPLESSWKIGKTRATAITQAVRDGAIVDAEKQNGSTGGVYLIYMQYPELPFSGLI